MKYKGSDSNDLYILANELAEANRLKKLEILWASRTNDMTDRMLLNLMNILKDPENKSMDPYGCFEEEDLGEKK